MACNRHIRLLLLLLIGCMAQPALAQYDGKEPDVASRHRPGFMWYFTGKRPAGKNSAPKYDRFMIDLTYHDWVNDSTKLFSAHPGSIGFNIHAMRDFPLTLNNTVGLGIGLSYRHQHIRHDGLLLRDSMNRATLFAPNALPQPDKSVFATDAFAIPIELRFRTPQWKHVKLHLGFHVGYRVRTLTKVWNDGDRVKNKDFFDDEPFFCGVHARLGIRNWAFFADYSLVKQFSSGNSTSLNPVSFGITCSLF